MFDIKKGDRFETIDVGTIEDVVGKPEIVILRRKTTLRLFGQDLPVAFVCHYYTGMMPPLEARPQAHALMHYVRLAMASYRIHIENADTYMIAAGDDWKSIPQPSFEGLFISCADMYGVETGAMMQAWDNVLLTCATFHLGEIPEVVRRAGPVRIIH